MNRNVKKKLITYILVLSTILSASNQKRKRELPSHITVKATYSLNLDNNLYIISPGQYERIKPYLDKRDIVVIDERFLWDSNMSIKDSYRINNIWKIRQVLNILLSYEEQNPSNWNRTLESMEIEWLVHNFLSALKIENKRTNDVDLNNQDENVYKSRILARKNKY